MAGFDPEGWIRLLDEHRVVYVMVGGYAGTLHGSSVPTRDIDIVPTWQYDNLQRLCDALKSVDARARTGPPASGDAITPELLIDREVMNWDTSLGHIDTLLGIPDAEGLPVTHDQLAPRVSVTEVSGVTIAVASLDDVITSKEWANREKDRRSLPELRRLRDAQRSSEPTDAALKELGRVERQQRGGGAAPGPGTQPPGPQRGRNPGYGR